MQNKLPNSILNSRYLKENLLKLNIFLDRKSQLIKKITANPKIQNPEALAKQLIQKNPELQVKYNRHTLFFNNDGSALYHILNSIDKIEKLVKSVFDQWNSSKTDEREELNIFFDVGANLGLFTVFVKDYFPDATVHIFEADPLLIPYIEKNIAGLSNVFIHNQAISDKHQEKLRFYRNSKSLQTNSLIREAIQPFAETIDEFEVESQSIDEFVKDHEIGKVDVIKLDIQGAEYIALKGSTGTLKTCSYLLLEVCFLMPQAIESLKLAHNFFPNQVPINDIIMGADLLLTK